MIRSILIFLLILYLISSVLVYFLANSNILPQRRKNTYTLSFGSELKYFTSALDESKSVAYWKAVQTEEAKNVILLHGFTRTSEKSESRAQIYWENGYNLYFVDNLGHGYSSNLLYPSGYRYSIEVRKLIEIEGINKPIIHGMSMGAIAASVIAQQTPEVPEAIICEALAHNFNHLYRELLRYLSIPYFLFPWLEWLSKKLNWKQFEEMGLSEDDYHPDEVSCPFFLIHSSSDELFHYKDHYSKIVEKMEGSPNFYHWLVPDGGHTRMVNNEDYEEKLEGFLSKVQTLTL